MSMATNPYKIWLGLDVSSRPDCYTLLGLPLYESDHGKILAACQNATARASIPVGPAEEPLRQALIGEIQAAQNCLLDANQKANYDQQLQAYYAGQSVPTGHAVQTAPVQQVATAPVAAPPAKPIGPKLESDAKSAAKGARSRAQNSSTFFYASALAIILLGGGGGIYYYFNIYVPGLEQAQEVAKTPIIPTPVDTPQDVAETTPKSKLPETSDGNRPSASDLASSIPGMGNPDDAMDQMGTDSPSMMKPQIPVATPADQQALAVAIKDAWNEVKDRNFAQAATALQPVRKMPKTEAGKQEFDLVDQFVQDQMTFQRALSMGLETLEEGQKLQVGSTSFEVSRLTDSHIVIDLNGKNRAYERESLPEGLRRAIARAHMQVDENRKNRVEASFLLMSSLADPDYIRELWTRSGSEFDAIAKLEKKRSDMGIDADTGMETGSSNTEAMSESTNPSQSVSPVQLLAAARQDLATRKIDRATTKLDAALKASQSPANQVVLRRWIEVAHLNDAFWSAVSAKLSTLEADSELDANGTIVRVIEAGPDRILIRMAGTNRRYTLADMPAGLAKFLAEQQLITNPQLPTAMIGAFLLVEPAAGADKAREAWMTAKNNGADVSELEPLLSGGDSLQSEMVSKTMPPAKVPNDAKLNQESMKVMKKWAAELSSASDATDHSALGNKLLADAADLPHGSLSQFATYRLALAEFAKAADFANCAATIESWSNHFEINPAEWHIKSLQLAATSQDKATHQAIVDHAEQLATKLESVDSASAKTIREIAKRSRDISNPSAE